MVLLIKLSEENPEIFFFTGNSSSVKDPWQLDLQMADGQGCRQTSYCDNF